MLAHLMWSLMGKFFLSYVHEYRHLAGKVKDALEENGSKGFLAHEDIAVSSEWRDEILKNLDSCTGVIAIVTPGFAESPWVNQEVGIAIGKRKPVVPLAFEIELDRLPGFLESLQGVRLTEESLSASTKQALEVLRNLHEDYEIQTYTIALLGLISDVELTLTCYRDTLIEPDFSQMLNTIGGYGEYLLRMSQAKPAEQLGIAEEISKLSECITNLAKYPFTVGAPDRFGDSAKTCLSILMKIKQVLNKTAKVQSSGAYLLKLKKALGSLKRDWEIRARRFETRQVELLKQALLQHGFAIYRFAAYPEAVELDLKDQLIALGQRLHELSSAEKYFPSYVRDGMLERIEGKYSECESLIDGIMKKAT
jgi:hypothetical protein